MSQINYDIVSILLKQDNHIRSLARCLNTNQTTLARKVQELETQNILDCRNEGKNKVYFIKKTLEAREYIKLLEYNKLLRAINNYPELRQIIEKINLNKKIKLAILFGSYAKDNVDKESDIDLYLETQSSVVKNTFEIINSKLSIKIGKFDVNNALVKEIIKDHIIIKGVDRYYELVY